jgi:branched-chain amino acid transport system permease protein
VFPLSEFYPALSERFLYVKEAVFGLAIVAFLLYEPRGLAYRWQQLKNYFNLWPFVY